MELNNREAKEALKEGEGPESGENEKAGGERHRKGERNARLKLGLACPGYLVFSMWCWQTIIRREGGSVALLILAYDEHGWKRPGMVRILHALVWVMSCFCINTNQPLTSLALRLILMLLNELYQ